MSRNESHVPNRPSAPIPPAAQLESQLVVVRGNAALMALEGQVPADLNALRENAKEPRQHLEPSDSAGAYWAWSAASRSADAAAAFVRASAGAFTYYTHSSFGNVAATVNVGQPSTHYASIYGVQARFQAHTAAVTVLMDREQFPDAQGQMKDVPEGWARRLP